MGLAALCPQMGGIVWRAWRVTGGVKGGLGEGGGDKDGGGDLE